MNIYIGDELILFVFFVSTFAVGRGWEEVL